MRKDILITLKSLKELKMASPNPTFKQNAKSRLIERIKLDQNMTVSYAPRVSNRFVYPFAFAVFLLFSASGTVFAAQSSNPNEFLYPVKIASEKVALAITSPIPSLNSQVAELVEKRRVEETTELEKREKQDFDKNSTIDKEDKVHPAKKQEPKTIQEQNKQKPTKGQVKSKSTQLENKTKKKSQDSISSGKPERKQDNARNDKPEKKEDHPNPENNSSEKSNSKSKN